MQLPLALVAAVVAGTMLGAAVATADGPVQLKNRLADLCLDGPSGEFNAPTVINPCTESDSQRWNLNSDGAVESVAFPGNCLALGVVNQWLITLVPCTGWISQRWSLRPNGQIANAIGPCLSAGFGEPSPGTLVNRLNCALDGPGQEWDVIA
ncbi:RICIN domain-containing protein [Mycobacterium sp. ML4]